MKVRLHPLTIALAVMLVAFGRAQSLFWTFLAVSLHELGHAVMARSRGYIVKNIAVLPFGAVMNVDDNLDRTSSVIVGLAGPLTNAFLALVTLGLWWLFPQIYSYTRPFLWANVSLAVFNLLPAYPLDGSRIVVGLSKKRLRAVKCVKIMGIAISVLLMALFIVSAFFEINFSLGITSIFLFYGATADKVEQAYISVFSFGAKNYDLGVEKRVVQVSADIPISRLLRFVSPTYLTEFEIMDGERTIVVNETRLQDVASRNKLSAKLKDVL